MFKLREEFQKQQESKFSGTELLFETSNEKYINWLEQKTVNKNDLLPLVMQQSELLIDFLIKEQKLMLYSCSKKELIDKFIKSINSV